MLQTKNSMAGVNLPHGSALGKMLKEGLSDDKAWSEAVEHAEVLNKLGYVLMADSRCPDKVWADAAAQLRDGSGAMLKALEERNASDAKAAFDGQVLKSCSGCHEKHEKEPQVVPERSAAGSDTPFLACFSCSCLPVLAATESGSNGPSCRRPVEAGCTGSRA